MIRRGKPLPTPLSKQMGRRASFKKKPEYDGNVEKMISTGSTLLDLAISGGRVKGGGMPGGILVEIFGPSGSGKTVLLCEIAGAIQRKGGDVMFHDPEARLNMQFARMFGLKIDEEYYLNPDTIPEVFSAVRKWNPAGKKGIIHGIFADSLAALSTDLEMENEEGDKMGGRRGKEFSEQLRKTCRILKQKNYLMVCSNQIRQNVGALPFEAKTYSPGGEAIKFYPSLRLQTMKPKEIEEKRRVAGREVTRVTGVRVQVKVFKSTIWKPLHTAPITILFDYGIDDIRENLQFIKDHTKNAIFYLEDTPLDVSMEKSIEMIEKSGWEYLLKEQVIDLWNSIESRFSSDRKEKKR